MSILFFFILAIGILLYVTGQRVASAIIFFFFLVNGFQLVPETFFGLKPLDYAVIYVTSLMVWGCYKYSDFIPKNGISLCIAIYLGFIVFEMGLSNFHYNIPWSEIIRTARQHLLVLSYFVLRRLSKSEIDSVFRFLFFVLLVQCVLFILQAFTGLPLLIGNEGNLKIGWSLYRCYNIPIMTCLFVFYALFNNPFANKPWKYATMILPVVTILITMHRSWIIIFVLVLILGFSIKFKLLESIRNIIITSGVVTILLVTGSIYIGNRTMNDINKVSQGEFLDTEDIKLDGESSLLFRFAHLFERYVTITETTTGSLFGLGFMAEGSSYTNNNFNFIIGLSNDSTGETIQIDTSDIAWSMIVVRYGIVGTIILMAFYIYLIVACGKKRKNPMVLAMMLYMVFIIGLSITSDQLYYISFLVFPLTYFDLCHE